MDTPQDQETLYQETQHRDDRNEPLDVVVGVDGSFIALQAVRWAVAEARLRGLRLRILHAAPYTVDSPAGRTHARDIRALAFVVAHRTDAGVPVTTHLAERYAVPSLLDAAQRAPLLVVGLGGGRRPEEVLISSVALDISRHCSCPVAVVRGGHRPPTDHPVPVVVVNPRAVRPTDATVAVPASLQ